jgi:hypothetical protein
MESQTFGTATADRSAASTVEIFRSLVGNHAEVDVAKAVAAGGVNDGLICVEVGECTTSFSDMCGVIRALNFFFSLLSRHWSW